MQITATLSGSTATIATSQNGISTALTIKDAANLAADLVAFTDPTAPSVDASTFTTSGIIPPTRGLDMTNSPSASTLLSKNTYDGFDASRSMEIGGQRHPTFQVHSRGYWLDATDDGVRITDPATNGKMTIPRDQIAAVIAGLNA